MFAKKSLGQNFLTSQKIVCDVVMSSNITNKDTVLEIGPGKGVLTEELLKYAKKVFAIEKDERLIEVLQEKFINEIKNEKLILINEDILDYDIEKNINSDYILVANIPYYITGALFKKFLSSNNQPKKMVLMLQKEVAKRIVASDKKESLLSMSIKVYGTPKYIQKVKAQYFSPKPKVDSAILLVDKISKKYFKEFSEEKFFIVVKTGFAHKRKLLARNLEELYPKEKIKQVFDTCLIPEKSRAEDLCLQDWLCLLKKV